MSIIIAKPLVETMIALSHLLLSCSAIEANVPGVAEVRSSFTKSTSLKPMWQDVYSHLRSVIPPSATPKGPLVKKRLGPVERLFPMPCPLVVGGTLGNADMLAVAWINIVASTPPTIAMGLRESRRTLELIRETGTLTVNIPTAEQAAIVDFCGITTGRKTDKFAETGLTAIPSAVVETPIIAECPYNIECRVTEEVTVGSYVIVLGEIVEAHADEAILSAPDGDLIDVAALDPLVYIAGSREYRRLGEKVADAFQVGRELMGDAKA